MLCQSMEKYWISVTDETYPNRTCFLISNWWATRCVFNILFQIIFKSCLNLKTDSENQIWAATWQNQQSDYAPSEDSDQPGHPPSLIRVFAVHMKNAWVLSYPLSAWWRLWSDWADAQADLSLRWAHSHFVGFIMSQLIYYSQLRHAASSYGPGHAKTCLMAYANNKGADQPAHPRSLISTFVVRCLDSMICILALSKVSRF